MDEKIKIKQATTNDSDIVADLVWHLLDELSPGEAPELERTRRVSRELMNSESVTALLATNNRQAVGVLVLNHCAAIYAGGVFGEISELYVQPEFRSKKVAATLVAEAAAVGRTIGWSRLEVGAPDQPAWQRTLNFYLKEGFKEIGPRLGLSL